MKAYLDFFSSVELESNFLGGSSGGRFQLCKILLDPKSESPAVNIDRSIDSYRNHSSIFPTLSPITIKFAGLAINNNETGVFLLSYIGPDGVSTPSIINNNSKFQSTFPNE